MPFVVRVNDGQGRDDRNGAAAITRNRSAVELPHRIDWLLGADLNPAATQEQIAAVEGRLGIELPPALRALYLEHDGFASPAAKWDWYFWPLVELRSHGELYEDSRPLRISPLPTPQTPVGDVCYPRERHDISGAAAALSGPCTIAADRLIYFCDVLIHAPVYGFIHDPGSSLHGAVFASGVGQGFVSSRSLEHFLTLFCSHSDHTLLIESEVV